MPLTVPVDIPPQNKVEPIPMGLKGDPVVLPANTEESKITGLSYPVNGFAYQESTGKLFVQESTTIEVYSDFDGTLLDTFGIQANQSAENYANNICVIEDELFVLRLNQEDTIDVYGAGNGNLARSITLNNDIFSIAAADGDLLVKFSGSIHRIDTVNGDTIESVATSGLVGDGEGPIYFGGNLATISRRSSDSFETYINVFDGISDTLLGRVNIETVIADAAASVNFIPEVIKNPGGAEQVITYIDNGSTGNTDIAFLDNDNAVNNYVVTSDDEVEDGNIYYMDIPFGTSENRVNIEIGGTSYAVLNRKGSFIPDYALEGLTALYFVNNSFVVISLKGSMAADIYDYAKEAGAYTDPGLAFDTWRTPNPDRDTKVVLIVRVFTDGATAGRVIVRLDLDGGTTIDFNVMNTEAAAALGAGERVIESSEFTVPAGASYNIQNFSDPNGGNTISSHREFAR